MVNPGWNFHMNWHHRTSRRTASAGQGPGKAAPAKSPNSLSAETTRPATKPLVPLLQVRAPRCKGLRCPPGNLALATRASRSAITSMYLAQTTARKTINCERTEVSRDVWKAHSPRQHPLQTSFHTALLGADFLQMSNSLAASASGSRSIFTLGATGGRLGPRGMPATRLLQGNLRFCINPTRAALFACKRRDGERPCTFLWT